MMFPEPVGLECPWLPRPVAVHVSELMAGLRAREIGHRARGRRGPSVDGHDRVGDRRSRHGRALVVEVIDDPLSLSIFVMARVALEPRISVSVALMVVASEALAVAVLEQGAAARAAVGRHRVRDGAAGRDRRGWACA